jgi:hypothetical protein
MAHLGELRLDRGHALDRPSWLGCLELLLVLLFLASLSARRADPKRSGKHRDGSEP